MRLIAFLLSLTLFAAACKDNNAPEPNQFDRTAMLTAYADRMIVPRFEALANACATLATSIEAATANPTTVNLAELQTQWTTAVTTWQRANAFNFGPAGESGLRKGLLEEIGTFPIDAVQINAYIAAKDFSLNNFKRDTRGFYAIEYLLFRDSETLLSDPNRLQYLEALAIHLKSEAQRVHNAWTTYRAEFVANNGTDSGGSPSQLYNEFVRSFESLKNFKVGLPAGKRAGQTGPQPELAEAFYAKISLDLLKTHLSSIQEIYEGYENNGMQAWLNSTTGGSELITASYIQWSKVTIALAGIPLTPSLGDLMAEQHPRIDELHTELQKQTRFFKSDMSSLLGVAITFSSGDGD
jgi:uncharacterized protein